MKKSAIYQRKRQGASSWYNKWVQSPGWFWGFWGCVGACIVIYVANVVLAEVHPGNTWGLGYGIAAAVICVAVSFYGVRRRAQRLRFLGRTWYYLQFHVYGGALFLLLMFMHTGFSIPQGYHTWWLWVLSIWVVGSGLFGIVLQKWIPTMLSSGLTTEVRYERIPTLVKAAHERAESLVATASSTLRDFYNKTVAPSLLAPQPRLLFFIEVTGGLNQQAQQFEYVRDMLPQDEQNTLRELQDIYRTKLEMDAHFTLQRALRWWLYLHVPTSLLLLTLLAVHIFSVLYY